MVDGFFFYVVVFLVVLSVLVFVHEFGHYWVARRNGVRVEVFSIGFGPELAGFTDRAGTRWKFSIVPLGGYVRMFGDADAASTPGERVAAMTPEERAVSFHHKKLWQRAAIVAAGPAINIVFAMVVLAGLFMIHGHPFPPPVVGGVEPGSAAARAGIETGDRIIAIDGRPVARFAELPMIINAAGGASLEIRIDRDGEIVTVEAAPEARMQAMADGQERQIYLLGVRGQTDPYGPIEAVRLGVSETVTTMGMILASVGEIIVGDRSTEELGGPLRIAQMAGTVAQVSVPALIWFTALLSINLGLINLFPIPMLDGGHLLFYAFEAVRGRPLGERAQEYGFRIGLAVVLTLMLFVTWNDLVQLRVVTFLKNLIS